MDKSKLEKGETTGSELGWRMGNALLLCKV